MERREGGGGGGGEGRGKNKVNESKIEGRIVGWEGGEKNDRRSPDLDSTCALTIGP